MTPKVLDLNCQINTHIKKTEGVLVGQQFRRLEDHIIQHMLTPILILVFSNQNSNVVMVLFNFVVTIIMLPERTVTFVSSTYRERPRFCHFEQLLCYLYKCCIMWALTGCLNTKINLNYGNIKMRSYRVVKIMNTASKLRRRALEFKVCFSHGLHMFSIRGQCLWGPGQWY